MKLLSFSSRLHLALLTLLLAAGAACMASSQPAEPELRWSTRNGAWVFTLHFAHPPQIQATDQRQDQGYYYLDCASEAGPAKQADWPFKAPQITHVRRIYYPAQKVLRYIFYVPKDAAVRIQRAMPDARTCELTFAAQAGEPSAALAPAPVQKGPLRKMVVIDPGHGGMKEGVQNGCRSSSSFSSRYYYEKDITLLIARYLEQFVRQSPNMDAFMTRTEDRYVSLEDRIKLANESRGDLFLSIHLNATGSRRNRTARGFEIYYVSSENRAVNHQLAAMENDERVDLSQKDSSGETLGDLLRALANEKFPQVQASSRDLCTIINEEFRRTGPFQSNSRGVKSEAFRVLLNFNMPAALAECGFLDHDDDARILVSASGQRQIAALLFNAINRYFATVDPNFTPHPVRVN